MSRPEQVAEAILGPHVSGETQVGQPESCAPAGRRFHRGMGTNDWVLGFDADDTLWHNETVFEDVHVRYRTLLSRFHDAATVDRMLFATEMRNLEKYGYGIKGFMLSAIETAIELSDGRIGATEIQELIVLGQNMLAHPVDLLDGIHEIIPRLASEHRLLLITKGDLKDQERKLEKSGLLAHFAHIEIVSEKDVPTYGRILRRYNVNPERFVMVGNSVKSDILPVIELGGAGVHIPYALMWGGEKVDVMPTANGRFHQLKSVRELPSLLGEIVRR